MNVLFNSLMHDWHVTLCIIAISIDLVSLSLSLSLLCSCRRIVNGLINTSAVNVPFTYWDERWSTQDAYDTYVTG